MSTVLPLPTAHSLADARRRVRSPLERLRGTIRRYVSLEGACVLGLYLALWFWIGLLLDYGLFRAFTFDWVQSTPWGFRAGVLTVLVAGLLAALATAVVTRLFREFRDTALALVLERKFPHLLGDRLITAVELSDTRQAALQGYSVAMIEQTVQEAAERVEQVPLREVFDWRRLVRRGVVVGLLSLGLYVVAGSLFAGLDAATEGQSRLGGFAGLNQVSGIWVERNILLQNTIWPRQAHLEIVSLAPGENLTVGRDSQPPALRVRALKYVVAGAPSRGAVEAYRAWLSGKGETTDAIGERIAAFIRAPEEGWRALTWFDLNDVLPGQVSADAWPADWEARDVAVGPTLDEVELRLDRAETHQTLAPEALVALRGALEQLDARAAEPSMSRTLRKLKIPEAVYLLTRGNTTSGRTTLEKVADNEFAGQFGELKESGELPWTFRFNVQGEDYYTAARTITVVAPPALLRLESVERRPAYLYYGAAANKLTALRGQKQLFQPRDVLDRSGNDVSRIEVPAGTDVELKATANKDLRSVKLRPRKVGGDMTGTVQLEGGPHFTVRFPDVRQEQQVVFEMLDVEGVVGLRTVVLRPKDDFPPDANVEVKVIRKAKEGYMVTPLARVPFAGDVRDENGLADVRYAYTVERAESGPALTASALLSVGAIPLAVGSASQFLAAGYLSLALRTEKPAEPTRKVERQPMPRFERAFAEQLAEFPFVADKLGQAQKLPFNNLLKVFKIQPDEWERADEEPGYDFPLWKTNLKSPEGTTQGRYKMQLWVEAVDTDVDSDTAKDGTPRPHVSPSKEKFTFIVVSETELLAEISKDEEKLYDELQKVVNDLLEQEARLIQTTLDLQSASIKAENLGPMSVRAESIDRVLEKGQADAKSVAVKYAELLKELKINRVDAKMIQRVEKEIVVPLDGVADVEFQSTRDRMTAYRTALETGGATFEAKLAASKAEGVKAKAEVRQLIVSLQNILGSMKGLIEVNELIKILRDIEETEQRQADLVRKIKDELEQKILDSALEGTKPKEEKKP